MTYLIYLIASRTMRKFQSRVFPLFRAACINGTSYSTSRR